MKTKDPGLDVLIVGAGPDDVELFRNALERAGIAFEARVVDDAAELTRELRVRAPDVVVSESAVGDLTGLEAFTLAKQLSPETPFIIITRLEDDDLGHRWLEAGVAACVSAQHLDGLGPAINRALLTMLRVRSPPTESQDTAVRRRTEEALRRSDEELRRAQSIAKIGSWTLDLEAQTVTGSAEARRIYGLRRRDLTLERIQQIPLPEYRAALDEALKSLATVGGRYDVEFQIKRPTDGAVIDIRSMASYDAARNTVVGTIQDVTDSKSAERARREIDERYQRLFERNPAGVYRTTTAGQILECNDAFVSILGFPTRESVQNLNAAVFYFDSEERERTLAALRETGELRNFEVKLVRYDRTPCWCLLNSILIHGDGGRSTTIEGTLIDITERRLMEEKLLHAQKMETVAVFAGGVAHEFNNLLQGISGLVHEFRKRPATVRPGPRGFDDLDLLIERGRFLTRQLLVFSQRDTVERKVLDLNTAASVCCELVHTSLPENIDLAIELSEEVLRVEADQGQLEQVVLSLAINAQEAMSEGGRMVVRSGREESGWCFLEIQDSGRGIPDDDLKKVFDPFYSTKTGNPGSGIGLSVVHGIVSRCGGSVELESEVGQGTTVRIVLPPPSPASGTHQPAELTATGSQSKESNEILILVVDDEPLVREGVREMLVTMGFPVATADSVAAAKKVLSERPIRVLLTDVVLPDGSGMELVEQVKSGDRALPAIVMTGYSPETLDLVEIDVPLLSKPFGLTHLEAVVKSVVAGNNNPTGM